MRPERVAADEDDAPDENFYLLRDLLIEHYAYMKANRLTDWIF